MYIDVFSYDEDDMVEDPYLNKHLAHFGINIAAMQKVGANCILVVIVFFVSLYWWLSQNDYMIID